MTKNLKFFIDFDGTITQNDVVDMILERFASDEWRQTEKEWASGKIGSRECLSRQLALVRTNKETFDNFLKEVKVDSGFVDFIEILNKNGIPAFVVSDGFDLVIQQVLKRTFHKNPELFSSLPVICNKLEFTPQGLRVIFATETLCEHACANCKPKAIDSLSSKDDFIVFVGDGLSDRFAARRSDLVFAKNKLISFCKENKLNFLEFGSFRDITKWLNENLSAGDAEGEASILFKENHLKKMEYRRRQDPMTNSL